MNTDEVAKGSQVSIKARAGRAKSLNALIHRDSSILGQIFDRAAKLQQLETLVLQEFPEEKRQAYRVGNYQQGRLLLFTSSALNLTLFRYLKPGLLQRLQNRLPDLQTIELKIRPEPPVKKTPRKGKPISDQARQQIACLAREVEQPALRQALERLGCSQKSQR